MEKKKNFVNSDGLIETPAPVNNTTFIIDKGIKLEDDAPITKKKMVRKIFSLIEQEQKLKQDVIDNSSDCFSCVVGDNS